MRGRDLTNNVVVLVALAVVASFLLFYFTIPSPALSVLLNSLFVGAMSAIGVTYHKLLWDAWFNPYDFNRVRQMTLTIGGQWFVISCFILGSIYVNYANYPVTVLVLSLFGRYLATVVAVFQVTAPDYGDGLFYGADRKFLGLGLLAGAIVGTAAALIQGF